MLSYFSSPFVSLLLLLISFLLVVELPVSFSSEDPRFSNCTQTFECGAITNIDYPFWGHGRDEYCGLPGFELKCERDSAEIEILSESYHVLNINEENQTLRMATMNTWHGNCPERFINISLPSTLFTYSVSSTQNITLFYGCPSISQLGTNNSFACSVNNTSTRNYVWIDSTYPPPGDLSRCNVSIVVPVLEESVHGFTSSQSTLEEVVKNGFDVGFVMNATFCYYCEMSGGQCGYDLIAAHPTCYCSNGQYKERCPSTQPASRTIVGRNIVIGVSTLGSVFVIGIFFYCWKKRWLSTNLTMFWKRNKRAQKVVEEILKNYGSLAPKRYNYPEIKKISNSFRDKVGQGGYGSVYRGTLADGRLVAVKLLNKRTKGEGEDFINEVVSISQTSHVNVVSLLGFCFDGSRRALVYEFMANGSLEKFIHNGNASEAQPHLEWETLYKIAIGVARGLEYLHRGCNTRILHFDIKPNNILLDHDFTPKITDFGLAKLCPEKESIISMLGTRGTIGYIAPEVFSRNFGGVSHKSDVYSYGMMVLDIVGIRRNVHVTGDHTSEKHFPHWIYKRLELEEGLGLHGVMSEEGEYTRKMVLIALWCVQTNPMDRPAMGKVVEMLEGRHELLSIPPKPYLCSPPRDPRSASI